MDTKAVDVNIRHKFGWTPLMVAAVNGRREICKLLIKAGADPNAGDKFVNINRSAKEHKIHSLEGII